MLKRVMTDRRIGLWLFFALALTVVCAVSVTTAEAAETTEVVIPYNHTWHNYSDDPDVDKTFTYQIVGANADTVMPEGSENGAYYFTVEGTASGELKLNFPFTAMGEYDYTVSAYVPEPQEGYTYEPRIFTMKIFVSNESGELEVYALTIQDEELSKYDVLPLDPIYAAPIRIQIPYSQEFHNNTGDPTVDGTFWYVLTPVTDNCPMPEGTVDGQYIFAINGDVEDMLYLLLDFTEEGTYIYEFTAYVPDPQPGYTYDDTVYQITIVIGKDVDCLFLDSVTIINKNTGEVVTELPLEPAYDARTPDKPKPDTPKTGDETKLNTYLIIMGVSAAVIIGIVIFLILRNRKKDDE